MSNGMLQWKKFTTITQRRQGKVSRGSNQSPT